MIADRIGAIITRNKQILLVTGYDETLYWTPGGKIEHHETHESCLKRELFAELGIALKSIKHYESMILVNETSNSKQKNYYYITQYTGTIVSKAEITKILWYSRKDFLKKTIKVSNGVKHLIPLLIKDKFL